MYGAKIQRLLVAFLFIFSVAIQKNFAAYVPPEASVQALQPQGLRMSVPDKNGISLVAFHVKINDEFHGLEAGDIARDITEPQNGEWVYEDQSTELKPGDVVHYWINVIIDGRGYNSPFQQATI